MTGEKYTMEDRSMDAFGDNLERLIDDMGLTISDFADEVEINRSMIYRWISGESSPRIEHALAIANYSKRTLDWLFEYH